MHPLLLLLLLLLSLTLSTSLLPPLSGLLKIQQDREREDFFKIQQQKEDFFKIQQERENVPPPWNF